MIDAKRLTPQIVKEWELISGADSGLSALLWQEFVRSKPKIRRCTPAQEPFLVRLAEMIGHSKSPMLFIPSRGGFKLVPEPVLEAAAMSLLDQRLSGLGGKPAHYVCARTIASLMPFYFVASALGFAEDESLEKRRFLGRTIELYQHFQDQTGVRFLSALNRAIQDPLGGFREAVANAFQFHQSLLRVKEQTWNQRPFRHGGLKLELKRLRYLFVLSGITLDRDLQVAQSRYGSFDARELEGAGRQWLAGLRQATDLAAFFTQFRPAGQA